MPLTRQSLFSIGLFVCGLVIGSLGYHWIREVWVPERIVTIEPIITTSTSTHSEAAAEASCNPDPFTWVSPKPGEAVTFPLKVHVQVENRKNTNCRWTLFEGQAGVLALVDAQGKEYARQPLMMTSDNWMTDEVVDFETILAAPKDAPLDLMLVAEEEDPSGMGDVRVMKMNIQQASACTMKPETGPCKAAIKKFYFNKLTGTCESFTWGGCQGSVPFQTQEACSLACVKK